MCVSRRNAEQAVIHALLESRIEGTYDQVNGVLQVVNTSETVQESNSDKKPVGQETSKPKTEEATSSTMTSSILELKQDTTAKSNDDRVLNGLSRMIGKWTVAQENLQNTLILDMLNS